MTAVQSTPSDPIALADKLAGVSIIPAPALKSYTAAEKRLRDQESIKKAIFDTAYEPNANLWADDQAAHQSSPDDAVPSGFPVRAEGKSVWDGKKLINEPEKWLHVLTEEEVADVRHAIDHFVALDLPFDAVSKNTFPLKETLQAELKKATQEIHHGLGLRVLRGLPVKSYSRKEQIIAFLGISSYLGRRRNQGGPGAGNRGIVHLRDLTVLDDRPAILVKGQTNGNQVFHNDNGDIVGLLTLGKAQTGGLSQLSSVGQTYNSFVAKGRADILRTLAAPDWQSKFDTNHRGSPLIHYVDGRVISAYARRPFFDFFESSNDQVPLAHEKHIALDAVHFVAEEGALDVDLQPGDLEFFNNLTCYHARTASTDSPENTRHLLRVWLTDDDHQLNHGPVLDGRWAKLDFTGEPRFALEAWDEGA